MKIRAVISGRSVHDVGYRIFLLNKALSEGIEGFSASNVTSPDGSGQVIVLAEGDEEAISEFSAYINDQIPPHAEVASVVIEPYERKIMRTIDYMHLIQVEQLDKGIPAILSIKNSQDQMLSKQDQMLTKQDSTISEIHGLRTDLKTDMNERFNKIETELQTIKDALHRSGIMA
ncbi:MAG: acylphosphatase [Methanospirillum sp.]|uniref:acylphosphatase n=1 Tax=Methanospirillum sp. TaxID=45200 RepID=UPI00236E26DD|nr:acylphosphatase [Methanospirillum sp.]MDD1729030.1 acylphosphatase [Methanospirillum sp.]